MIVLTARKRDDLLKKIQELNPKTREVYINIRPSIQLIVALLNRAPELTHLYLSPSIAQETPKKITGALTEVGVKLMPISRPRGRPRKRSDEQIQKVRKLALEGIPAQEIAIRIGLPLRTVYYYFRKFDIKPGVEKSITMLNNS